MHTASSELEVPFPVPGGLANTTAHWLHVTQTATLMHTLSSSNYFATFAGGINIGIEHVPEPATPVLFAGGVLVLALSRCARRRRLQG